MVEASRALEAESRTWTDFSKATFHSRSAFLLDGVWSGADAFGGFGEGKAWAAESDRREDVRDVARRWAEECDRMQGFQVFAEDLCGFGGRAAATLEELRDEYPRQPAWLFSLRPPKASSHTARRAADAEAARHFLLNDALATATLAPLCDAYVPLGADAAAGSRASDALPPGFFGAEGRNAFRAAALAAAAPIGGRLAKPLGLAVGVLAVLLLLARVLRAAILLKCRCDGVAVPRSSNFDPLAACALAKWRRARW